MNVRVQSITEALACAARGTVCRMGNLEGIPWACELLSGRVRQVLQKRREPTETDGVIACMGHQGQALSDPPLTLLSSEYAVE